MLKFLDERKAYHSFGGAAILGLSLVGCGKENSQEGLHVTPNPTEHTANAVAPFTDALPVEYERISKSLIDQNKGMLFVNLHNISSGDRMFV